MAYKSATLAARLRQHDACPEDRRDALAADASEHLSGAAEVEPSAKVSAIKDSSPFNIIAEGPMLTVLPAWN